MGMMACMTDARPITVAEYEPLARARTDPGAWDYQAGGRRRRGLAGRQPRRMGPDPPPPTRPRRRLLAKPGDDGPRRGARPSHHRGADRRPFPVPPRRRAGHRPRRGSHRRALHAVDHLVGGAGGRGRGRAGRTALVPALRPRGSQCVPGARRARRGRRLLGRGRDRRPADARQPRARPAQRVRDRSRDAPAAGTAGRSRDRDRHPPHPRLERARLASIRVPDPAAREGCPPRR